MTRNEERINALFEELVPMSGAADTVAGEIIRATARIGYRWVNDGDQLGIGYGKETCNPAARYLAAKGDDAMARILSDMWGLYAEHLYEEKLDTLLGAVLDFIDQHPELKTMKNEEDMWDYRDEHEDVDTYDEEDESDWY